MVKRQARPFGFSQTACASLLAALLAAPAALAATAGPGGWAAAVEGELIDWRPWGEQVFAESSERGLPIFLSLGATWDHDCQRMSAESFSDPAIAEVINQRFIPVKIDRDEAPQLDVRFQASLYRVRQMASSGPDRALGELPGVWPLTGFLTPEGRLFAGDNYLAAEDQGTSAGLETLARHVHRQYQRDQREYHNTAEEIANLMLQTELGGDSAGELATLTRKVGAALVDAADPDWGGFGRGRKQIRWPAYLLALELGGAGSRPHLDLAVQTLNLMASGGVRDLLGGGFHRTADRAWRRPHFEKLLVTNAGLLESYALAGHLTGIDRFRRVAAEILDDLLADLAAAGGGFYNAQAADLGPGDDGSTYTWTAAQASAVLDGLQDEVARAYFRLGDDPRCLAAWATPGEVAVQLGKREDEVLEALFAAIDHLRQARAERPAPPIDRSMYTAANGLAAHAMLVAARLLDDDRALAQAEKTLDRLGAAAWSEGAGLARGLRAGATIPGGLLADQVIPAWALVHGYEMTGRDDYLERARKLLDGARERHLDPSHGGLLDLPHARGSWESVLIIPDRPVRDAMLPGANAIDVLAEERLGRILGDDERIARARKTAEAFAGSAASDGPAAATLTRAAHRLLEPPPVVVIARGGDPAASRRLAWAALGSRQPGVAVRWVDGRSDLARVLGNGGELPAGEGSIALVTGGGEIRVAETPDELQVFLEASVSAVAMPGRTGGGECAGELERIGGELLSARAANDRLRAALEKEKEAGMASAAELERLRAEVRRLQREAGKEPDASPQGSPGKQR